MSIPAGPPGSAVMGSAPSRSFVTILNDTALAGEIERVAGYRSSNPERLRR
jgi:hypothetical protein